MEREATGHLLFESGEQGARLVRIEGGEAQSVSLPEGMVGVENPSMVRLTDSSFFVCGGRLRGSGECSAEAAVVDLKEGKVEKLESMRWAREDMRLVRRGGKVFAIGGTGQRKNLSEVFDLESGKWTDLPPMKADVVFREGFAREGGVFAVGSGFVVEELTTGEAKEADAKREPKLPILTSLSFVRKPRHLTPVGSDQLIFSNDRDIYLLDLREGSLSFLATSSAKPVSILVKGPIIEILDLEFGLLRLDLANLSAPPTSTHINPRRSFNRRQITAIRTSPDCEGLGAALPKWDPSTGPAFLDRHVIGKLVTPAGIGCGLAVPLAALELFADRVTAQCCVGGTLIFANRASMCIWTPGSPLTSAPLAALHISTATNFCLHERELVFATINNSRPNQAIIQRPDRNPAAFTIPEGANHITPREFPSSVFSVGGLAVGTRNSELCFLTSAGEFRPIGVSSICFDGVFWSDKARIYHVGSSGELCALKVPPGPEPTFEPLRSPLKLEQIQPLIVRKEQMNVLQIGEVFLFAAPPPKTTQPPFERFLLCKGPQVIPFSLPEELTDKLESLEVRFSPTQLEASKYFLGLNENGMARAFYGIE